MGYTHYWTMGEKTSVKTWKTFADNVKALVAASGVTIRNGLGNGSPSINTKEIWLNGDAKTGQDHETFSMQRDWGIGCNFCKTARKDYDTVVVASLMEAKRLGIIREWSSDGDAERGDFKAAEALLKAIAIKS